MAPPLPYFATIQRSLGVHDGAAKGTRPIHEPDGARFVETTRFADPPSTEHASDARTSLAGAVLVLIAMLDEGPEEAAVLAKVLGFT